MQTTDILAQVGGLESMARELGVGQAQVASGAEALVPAIHGGFVKQAQSQPAGDSRRVADHRGGVHGREGLPGLCR